jgi:hypothetical protein
MGETQRSSLALPQSKKIQVRNTKVITLPPSTIEKPREKNKGHLSPSLYQRETLGETQRSSLSIPLLKRIHGRNTKVIALHPSTEEKYRRNTKVISLPPSTKEKPWERHTGHHFPSLY